MGICISKAKQKDFFTEKYEIQTLPVPMRNMLSASKRILFFVFIFLLQCFTNFWVNVTNRLKKPNQPVKMLTSNVSNRKLLSANMLGNIGQFLPPKDSVGKMPGTSKQWSKVNLNLLYENVTTTKDPIAVFKKIDETKYFLEDPKNLLDPAINGYNACGEYPTIDFSTATWGEVFEYSIRMRDFLRRDRFNRLFSENATEFMKVLATNAAQNCPLDFKVRGWSPLWYAVYGNDVDAASILLQRGAVIEPNALAEAIWNLNPEMMKFLLENGADVHAETDLGGRPMPIYEFCAQGLQRVETRYERGTVYYSLSDLQKLRVINKLVMDKKEKT